MAHSLGTLILLFLEIIVFLLLCLGWSPMRFAPFTLICVLVIYLLRSYLYNPVVEISWVKFPWHFSRHNLNILHCFLCCYNFPMPSSIIALIITCRSCVVDTFIVVGYTTITCSLQFVYLWFFELRSICCREVYLVRRESCTFGVLIL